MYVIQSTERFVTHLRCAVGRWRLNAPVDLGEHLDAVQAAVDSDPRLSLVSADSEPGISTIEVPSTDERTE